MDVVWDQFEPDEPLTAGEYAVRRTLGRFITSRAFPLKYGRASEVGQPTKTAWQVVADDLGEGDLDGPTSMTEDLYRSPKGRVQVQARVVGVVGGVSEIRIQRVEGAGGPNPQVVDAIRLDAEGARRLFDFCALLSGVDPREPHGFRVDEAMIRQVVADPERLKAIYAEDPSALRALIEGDVDATDVLALRARQEVVERFSRMLSYADFFAEVAGGRGPEVVWQRFFEANPWLLGVGLSAHLFTSWDPQRLERYVAGSSVAGPGKEADALMETAGAIKALVYAEIKRHDVPLLETSHFRSGAWPVSTHVTRGVAQAHATVRRAQDDIGRQLERKVDGYVAGERAYNLKPRSYLVVGTLEDLTDDGRIHEEKFLAFEGFRRSLTEPEILTYDEVLARAKAFLELAKVSPGSADEIAGDGEPPF